MPKKVKNRTKHVEIKYEAVTTERIKGKETKKGHLEEEEDGEREGGNDDKEAGNEEG